MDDNTEAGHTNPKRRELLAFLFLTVVAVPVLSIVLVGGYGFFIWMYQIIVGPPGAG